MNKKNSTFIIIIILSIEKILQHLLTSLFFFVNIPGIGRPDIGSRFDISNPVMGILNIIYFVFLVIGLYGFIKRKNWGIYLILFFAALDILLEFTFHHFFFITISVIVSTILTIFCIRYLRKNK